MPRNDQRFAEDAALALVIYCDENGLTQDEGIELAAVVYDLAVDCAYDRTPVA